MPSGRSLGTLPGPPGSYESLAYSASGRWLAAVRHTGDAYTVLAWDLATGGDPIVVGPAPRFPLPARHGQPGRGQLDDHADGLRPQARRHRPEGPPDRSTRRVLPGDGGRPLRAPGGGGVPRRSPRRCPRPHHRSIASDPRHAEPRTAGVQPRRPPGRRRRRQLDPHLRHDGLRPATRPRRLTGPADRVGVLSRFVTARVGRPGTGAHVGSVAPGPTRPRELPRHRRIRRVVRRQPGSVDRARDDLQGRERHRRTGRPGDRQHHHGDRRSPPRPPGYDTALGRHGRRPPASTRTGWPTRST